MELLSRLSPGDEVLRRLQEAYRRVTAEVAEEETGDAGSASVSEGVYGGLGVRGIGHGGGGAAGYGVGSGRGGMRGRGSGAPRVRVGTAQTSGVSGFARVVREKFPPTLLFTPTVAIDPSGKTAHHGESGSDETGRQPLRLIKPVA